MDPGDIQRQLEEASRAIKARAREIEANGGPAPQDVRSATEGHWDDIPDSVQVSYERAVAPPGHPSGVCPACDRPYSLTKTGKVWTHNNAIRDRQSGSYGMRCSGAGQPPKEQQ